jgi:GTPase
MATTSNDINQVNEMVEDLSIDRIAPKAIDYSSIQSKSVLVSPTEEQFELLRRRLADRMLDSRGETIYDIGVGEDASDQGLDQDEYDASVATLHSLATCLNAECVKLRQGLAEKGKITGQFLIREKIDEKDFMEIRVAVVGNVDAGKSTLLGVLTHGELDNGRGHARQRLFRHKHEMESGRTSSVGNDILVRTFSFHILMK